MQVVTARRQMDTSWLHTNSCPPGVIRWLWGRDRQGLMPYWLRLLRLAVPWGGSSYLLLSKYEGDLRSAGRKQWLATRREVCGGEVQGILTCERWAALPASPIFMRRRRRGWRRWRPPGVTV